MIQGSDALGKLNSWRNQLTADGHKCDDCQKNILAFYSTHKLEGSGTNLIVRTMAVALHHQPKDKSARISAARKSKKKS